MNAESIGFFAVCERLELSLYQAWVSALLAETQAH